MSDVFEHGKRSEIMSKIRSRDTKPEIFVRRLLFAAGFRFRLDDRRLPGRPDVVLPKWRTVVFVHGCFWHSHEGCSRATMPSTHENYWALKLQRNRARDAEVLASLLDARWRVLIVWECSCKTRYAGALQTAMANFIRSNEDSAELLQIGRAEMELATASNAGSEKPA